MRLLNVHSLQLQEFTDGNIPEYCILSHRWGEDEVSFKEFRKHSKCDGEGYRKIYGFCEFVKRMPVHWEQFPEMIFDTTNMDWVWIDTCKTIAA